MDIQTLQTGFDELDLLSEAEYHESLQKVLSESDGHHSAIRIGRLVGVLLKEPFSTSEPLSEPSYRTSAFRSWHLKGADEFAKPEKAATWQYHTLDQIRRELASDYSYYENISVYDLARQAQFETGFFGCLAETLRKYICGDSEIREKVENALGAAGNSDKNLPTITPETIVGAGGLTLGVILVDTIPILGFVGAPVIAAVVVILYTLGVDAFCSWSEYLRIDEDEQN